MRFKNLVTVSALLLILSSCGSSQLAMMQPEYLKQMS